jgi:hypothetical protein
MNEERKKKKKPFYKILINLLHLKEWNMMKEQMFSAME